MQCDVCSGNRIMPVPRRSGDDAPCSPSRGRCTALRHCIPADCVLAGPGCLRRRTGRTSRRRLSHVTLRKERASFARARPDKGSTGPAGGLNGCGMPEVAKLKHAVRGARRTRDGLALRDKAEQWCAENLPTGDEPAGPVRRENSPGCLREMFHALYMRAGAGPARSHGYTATPLPATPRSPNDRPR